MAAREPKALTFDVIGTLIDFESGLLAYLREAAGRTRRGRAIVDPDVIGRNTPVPQCRPKSG